MNEDEKDKVEKRQIADQQEHNDPYDQALEDIEPIVKDPLIGNDPIEDDHPVVNPIPVNLDPSVHNQVINPGVIIDDEPENPDEIRRRD